MNYDDFIASSLLHKNQHSKTKKYDDKNQQFY